MQLWLIKDKIRLDVNGNYQKNESDLQLNDYTKLRLNPALQIYFSRKVAATLEYIREEKDGDEDSTFTANALGIKLSINY